MSHRLTPLVKLDTTVFPVPAGMIVRSLLGGAFVAFYFGTATSGAEGGAAFLFVLWLVASAMFAAIIIGPPIRRVRAVALELDDGGMRLLLFGQPSYWPFALLAGAELGKTALRDQKLVIKDKTGRSIVEVPLLNARSRLSAETVVSVLVERVAAAHLPPPEAPPGLARAGRSLEDWRSDLRRMAELPEVGDYRERGLDRGELVALLDAPGTPVETRAAASYVLLCSERASIAARACARLGPASPPITLALARSSPAGELPVSRAELDRAIAFLDADDRDSLAGRDPGHASEPT